jgi:carbon-monoxide dehydrogenase medium subunit
MNPFSYHRATSSAQAVSALAGKSDAKYLAGGQSLLPTMRLRLASPTDLVDLGGIGDIKGIKVDGNTVTVGAMTCHADVAASADVKRTVPALAELAEHIGDRQVRNRGTIGGSLANNDPAACYPSAVLGLGAMVHTNKRAIAADSFFKGLYETALEEGELITSVAFPAVKKASYQKFNNPASRFALVGVFVSQGAGGVRVAVTGAGQSGVFRVASFEQALSQSFTPAAIDKLSVDAANLMSDLHADAAYRAHLIKVMTQRAVAAAAARA